MLDKLNVDGYAPRTRLQIGLRTASMRWMTRWPLRPLIASQFAKAGSIALPDYGKAATLFSY